MARFAWHQCLREQNPTCAGHEAGPETWPRRMLRSRYLLHRASGDSGRFAGERTPARPAGFLGNQLCPLEASREYWLLHESVEAARSHTCPAKMLVIIGRRWPGSL